MPKVNRTAGYPDLGAHQDTRRSADEFVSTGNPPRIGASSGVELYLCMFIILAVSEAYLPFFDPSRSSNILPIRPIILGFATVAQYLLLLLNFRQLPPWVPLPFVAVGFAAASLLWSAAPNPQAVFSLAGDVAFAAYLSLRFSMESLSSLIRNSLKIALIGSLIVIILYPSVGIHHMDIHSDSWRGVFYFKNHLGRYAALGAVLFLVDILSSSSPIQRIGSMIWLMLSCALVIGSRSTNGLILLFSGIFLVLYFIMTRRRYKIAIALTCIAIAISPLIFLLAENPAREILELLGKDESLTGRDEVWSAAIHFISQRPWLGWGYGGFWAPETGNPQVFGYLARWMGAPHAHNGLLQIMLDLGIVGGVISIFLILAALYRSYIIYHKENSRIYIIPIVFIILLVEVNLTESTVMQPKDLFWVIFITIYFKGAYGLR